MVDDVIFALKEVREEQGLNKNLKLHIDNIITFLESDPELGKDKALTEIEEMVEKNNMDPHIRQQIWSIMSMLESL
ncbi:MAG TPA: UPF0147 family protein [Candidatus Nanoarchaeia archaeon]|nr:UPF0147 family protein [Candidatus Nanoarchaeia archaeon]